MVLCFQKAFEVAFVGTGFPFSCNKEESSRRKRWVYINFNGSKWSNKLEVLTSQGGSFRSYWPLEKSGICTRSLLRRRNRKQDFKRKKNFSSEFCNILSTYTNDKEHCIPSVDLKKL